METPISKTQARAMALAGLAKVDSYEAAAQALENAKLRRDAVPVGGTWRTAAKMTDAEFMSAIRLTRNENFSSYNAHLY